MTQQLQTFRPCNQSFRKTAHRQTLFPQEVGIKEGIEGGIKEGKQLNLHILCGLCIGAILLTAVKAFKTTPKVKLTFCCGDDTGTFVTWMIHLLRESFTIHYYGIFRSYTRLIECMLSYKIERNTGRSGVSLLSPLEVKLQRDTHINTLNPGGQTWFRSQQTGALRSSLRLNVLATCAAHLYLSVSGD